MADYPHHEAQHYLGPGSFEVAGTVGALEKGLRQSSFPTRLLRNGGVTRKGADDGKALQANDSLMKINTQLHNRDLVVMACRCTGQCT